MGQVVLVNPAASVYGPRHIVKSNKTLVLELDEAAAGMDDLLEQFNLAFVSTGVYSSGSQQRVTI